MTSDALQTVVHTEAMMRAADAKLRVCCRAGRFEAVFHPGGGDLGPVVGTGNDLLGALEDVLVKIREAVTGPGTPCQSDGCAESAATRVYWPGQTTDKCERCAQQARAIAETMGFRLDTAPLSGIEDAGA